MTWTTAIIITILFFALTDIARKLAGGKIDPVWAAAISYAVASVVALSILVIIKQPSGIKTPSALLPVIAAGIAVSLGAIFHFKAFGLGAKLSVADPIMLTGIMLITSIIGFILLKEEITLRWILGLFLALLGIYLLATK